MFRNVLSELERLARGAEVSVAPPLDENGFFDRCCPSAECGEVFKVRFTDWRDKTSGTVFCPVCRFEAPSNSWNTAEQNEHMGSVAINYTHERISKAFEKDAAEFNRSQSYNSGLVTISLSIDKTQQPAVIPVEAIESMQQVFTCGECGCTYASIGLAYFCPACGHNSVVETFENTILIVKKRTSLVKTIQASIEQETDKDVARDTVRQILEGSLDHLVGGFEQYSRYVFNQYPDASKIKQRPNVFQNLHESSKLWKELTGKGYDELLSDSELRELEKLFQKRHLTSHRNGIVDEQYIARSGDDTYSVGQRLVISESDVLRLADILAELATQLKNL